MLGLFVNRAVNQAVSREEFSALMAGYHHQPCAVGVSGGADSVALLFLLARYHRGKVFALSVDHGLRPAAAAEARHAARIARRLGVPHVILRNRMAIATQQAAARDVRFALLADWCRRNQVRYCALAHHQADQAETFLFRLARGSGIDGLAAMAAERVYRDCHFIRPLLDVAPERLRAVLREAGISWREDPSNRAPGYSRTHLARALPILAAEGLSAERLARAARGAARLRGFLSQSAADFLRQQAEFAPGGYYWLARKPFYGLPRPIADHVLGDILRHIGGRIFRPSQAKLDHFYHHLLEGRLGAQRTLAGCRIIIRKTRFLIFREFADIGPAVHLTAGEAGVWDRRFHVRVARAAPLRQRFAVAPLGEAARDIPTDIPAGIPAGIPPIVRPCLPALWRDGVLLSVPHLGFHADRLALTPF